MGSGVSLSIYKESIQMGEDKISNLPEPIIHHILSFLPTKDTSRTSVLSKQWRDLWNSFPIINLEEQLCNKRLSFSKTKLDRIKEFVELVDRTLSNRKKNSSAIDKFKLNMKYHHQDLASRIDKWVEFALENRVQELHLSINTTHKSSPSGGILYYVYKLPAEVFFAESLTSLSLKDLNLELSCHANLPSLKILALISINLNDRILEILFSGCPLLQNLILEYCTMEKFLVSSTKMECIKKLHHCHQLQKARIQARNLQSFIFTGQDPVPYAFESPSAECEMNIFLCTKLTTLSLENANLKGKSWEDYISQLSNLEKLILNRCCNLTRIKICSKNVRMIQLMYSEMLEEVEIDAPNLVHFYYSGHLISLYSKNTVNCLKAEICAVFDPGDLNQCLKFRDFLQNFGHCRCLTMYCRVEQELIIPEEMREILNPFLHDLKNLKINVVESSMNYAPLTESLLWLSPQLEKLTIFSEFPSICAKYEFGEAKYKGEG